VHRGWIKVKSAVTGKDDDAILAEAARGEDVAVENYEDALGKDLPPEVRTMIDRQYRGVLENRDRVKLMKEGRSATRSATMREPDREAPPPM
ncbi:MAG: PA2169 family four-helix-bundle protein, partial [Gemmatimonadaceae bacterium]